LKAQNENANDVGLNINQEETKYLQINAKRSNIIRNKSVKMRQKNFESVETFSFLRSMRNDNRENSQEILTSVKKYNKTFFKNKKLLLSKLNGKQSKMKIYIYPL
jgi:hypothetical protein